MKKTAATLLLLACAATATAGEGIDRQSYCATYGAMFQTIAAWRDHGSEPGNTLKILSGIKGVSPQEKKTSVDAVYADPVFKGEHGPAFGHQMTQRCLAGKAGENSSASQQ